METIKHYFAVIFSICHLQRSYVKFDLPESTADYTQLYSLPYEIIHEITQEITHEIIKSGKIPVFYQVTVVFTRDIQHISLWDDKLNSAYK